MEMIKARGLMGLISGFIKNFWDLLKNDIQKVVKEFFDRGT